MPLNIISNFAAQVAHRNLSMSDRGASDSVAKISAGTRVLAARDDAAALAIGSRLKAEVAAMEQASVNAGQAVSMLQIADGAMSQINDTLIRMQALAVQAGSDQLGDVERGLIDTEFQQLLLEVDRIAEDTEFNGLSLIDAGEITSVVKTFDPGTDGISDIQLDADVPDGDTFQYTYNATSEVLTVTKLGTDGVVTNTPTEYQTGLSGNNITAAFDASVADSDAFAITYDNTAHILTVSNHTTGEAESIDIDDAFNAAFGASQDVIGVGESLDVAFGNVGATITLGENFDRTAAFTSAPAIAESDANNRFTLGANTTFTFSDNLSEDAINAFEALTNSTNGTLTLGVTAAGGATVAIDADAELNYSVNGAAFIGFNNASGDLIGASTVDIAITVNGAQTTIGTINLVGLAHDADGADGDITIDFGGLAYNDQTTTVTSDQSVDVDLTDSLDAVAGTGQNLTFDQTLDVDVDQFGVNLTLDKGFDRTVGITNTIGAVDTNSLPTGQTVAASGFAVNSGFLDSDVYQALVDLGYDSTTGIGYNTSTGVLHLSTSELGNDVFLDGLAGLDFGFGDGNATADLVGTGTTVDVSIATADGSSVKLGTLTGTYANGQPDGFLGTVDIQVGRGVFFNDVDENATSNEFTFKIGTGNEDADRITLSLSSVTSQALGINGASVSTSSGADAASVAISNGITTLNTARANVGAFQNRLEIATSNLATATENTEAARSALMDLDIASEMTAFTSKQLLVQAGVSMLSQANQLPQNLLRLLQ